jgi:hypothetical protein
VWAHLWRQERGRLVALFRSLDAGHNKDGKLTADDLLSGEAPAGAAPPPPNSKLRGKLLGAVAVVGLSKARSQVAPDSTAS